MYRVLILVYGHQLDLGGLSAVFAGPRAEGVGTLPFWASLDGTYPDAAALAKRLLAFPRRMVEGKRVRLEFDAANAPRAHKDSTQQRRTGWNWLGNR